MPLPNILEFIGTDVTEQGFKDAQKQLVEYVGNEVPKKVDTYTKAEVDTGLSAVAAGHKAYATLAGALANTSTFPQNSIIEITNDGANNGAYLWNGGDLVKSDYDPLTQAKADATTKANAAEANAKTYAENLPKLTDKIVSSNAKARKLVGLIAGELYSGGTITAYTLSLADKDKFSFLFKCKPNTTYTICRKARKSASIRELKTLPDSFASTSTVHTGQSVSGTNVSATIAGIDSRYHTFTTSAETNYIVYDPTAYTDIPFIVCEGEYSDLMWQSFMEQDQDKPLNVNTLNVEIINSPKIQKGKNLVQGYQYGSSISNSQPLYTELTSVTYLVGVSPLNANWKNYVGVRIPLEVGKTYTISKEPSNRFIVVMLRANQSSGKIVLRNVGLQEYTFTAGADDAYVYVHLSNVGETPRVQIEEGSKATDFESFGTKFNDPALPLGKKLTETSKQTDNTFISLGAQTDEFELLHNSVNYDTVLNKYYEPLRASFPHLISREVMGKDSTGTYDIYAYTFEPDHYEQKIVISAGMHPTEIVTPFALGILLNEIYRNPEKHEGLAYLRNKVKITVLPVINVWGMNQSPRRSPEHYVNPNGVNPSRNFPERWDVNKVSGGIFDVKGPYPLSEVETQYMHTLMVREKQDCAFSLDLHTNQQVTADTIVYWTEEDNFLRPVLEQVVSMKNDIVWQKYGREPVNQAHETGNATKNAYSIRVLGVPSATIEYGAGSTVSLSSQETTEYVDQLFNYIHYALKARLRDQIKRAEQNEHNKPYISLYNTLTAHNEVVGQSWTYAQWQTELYDKLGLIKSVIGAASGTYDLVKYAHEPAGYKNTIVLAAGKRGLDERKSVTELGFFAHKLMTDKNPHIVALRNNTRFIFIPCLNPHGHDDKAVNNANGVPPYLNFATSTQPESIALRSFIDSETIDLFVDISSLSNAYKPSGYADCQIIHNAKADADYQAVFAVLQAKYEKLINSNVANYSTSLVKSQIADYINSNGIAYSNFFFAQNVLPKRNPGTGEYEDFGYEAGEMAYCTEVLLNNIKEICQRRTLSKYLAN
ncbi:M14 family zinc carboxypeptidase [Acinetobacter towneri]|uniref:M14 family zinc carboxypeptidase n=1 Tax=Acinetobacter towneri TaxID=202956 RepID=UPI003A8C0014